MRRRRKKMRRRRSATVSYGASALSGAAPELPPWHLRTVLQVPKVRHQQKALHR